jgi:hypothetical protein
MPLVGKCETAVKGEPRDVYRPFSNHWYTSPLMESQPCPIINDGRALAADLATIGAAAPIPGPTKSDG